MALFETGVNVTVARALKACRDSKADKFLDLAVPGRADVTVTGDDDLLVQPPLEQIPNLHTYDSYSTARS